MSSLLNEPHQHRLSFTVLYTPSSKFRGLHITIRALTTTITQTKPEGSRDQQPASLTSRTSALKRGTDSLFFQMVSFHFQTFLQPPVQPSDKERKTFSAGKKVAYTRVSPTASYIISFRHFQSLTISTVTFLFCFLLIFDIFVWISWFLKSDVLLVGKPSEKDKRLFLLLAVFLWLNILQLRKLIWDQMGTIILHCVVKFYKCWNSLL